MISYRDREERYEILEFLWNGIRGKILVDENEIKEELDNLEKGNYRVSTSNDVVQ